MYNQIYSCPSRLLSLSYTFIYKRLSFFFVNNLLQCVNWPCMNCIKAKVFLLLFLILSHVLPRIIRIKIVKPNNIFHGLSSLFIQNIILNYSSYTNISYARYMLDWCLCRVYTTEQTADPPFVSSRSLLHSIYVSWIGLHE